MSTARLLFLAVLAMWLLIPVLIKDNLGQDAVPYLVAGEMVRSDPTQVYASRNGDLFDLKPAFAQRFCEMSPHDTDCPNVNVAFVSLPQSLPFAGALSLVGAQGGVLIMRLLAAGCLAGGMLILWNRLAGVSPQAPNLLAVSVLLLTPFAMVPLSLAQTSPVLFLGAALGVRRTDRFGRAIATSGVWVTATVLKAFPALLALVLLRQRRWRLLAISLGWMLALTALALVQGPTSLFGDFVRTSLLLGEKSAANPYNGSVDALLFAVSPSLTTGGTANVLLAVRLVAAGGLWWWVTDKADDDQQWAFGWLVLLLIVPFLWWHYLWTGIAALGIVIAGCRHPDRWLPALPITALVFLPLGVINSRGSSAPVVQAVFLLALTGFLAWLLRTQAPASERHATGPEVHTQSPLT